MRIRHHMRRERSGLAFSTLELAKYEERQGHEVCIQEPTGPVIHGTDQKPDIHLIHSQIAPSTYFDGIPKGLLTHGEPLSSVGNGVSMKAIVDLASLCDFFICMRRDEWAIWNSIKRTYVVPKCVDLEVFKPIEVTEKLSGEPAVLYAEHWRGSRNPLYLCAAMEKVWQKYPKARLHLYNCTDKKMFETFSELIRHNKWGMFVRTLKGPENDVNLLYNKCDIAVSCLFPLFARILEPLAAGKAILCPGYRENGYPWVCQLQVESMANAIISIWENYDKINYRKWAEDFHSPDETVRQCVNIYSRYI